MAKLVEMPKLSDTMEEGGIAQWLKTEGEFVEEGEPLVEIETDKSTIEFASPEEGTLLKILVKDGSSAALQAPIAVLGEKGESFDLAKLAPQKEDKATKSDEKTSQEKPEQAHVAPQTQAPMPAAQGRVKASPLAKKIAKDKGVELHTISGTGPHGRIVARDVQSLGSFSSSAMQQNRQDVEIPLTMMRKTIAKRLLHAKNDAPHFYLSISANMETLLSWRQKLNAQIAVQNPKARVSVNDMIMFITAKALLKHPEVNSSWQSDAILQHANVHMAFAVALPTGLITPVIRHADSLDLRSLSQQSKSLGKRAHAGELSPQEYEGGTFTVSNLGMTGVESFTAIINPPQACILAVGKTQKVPHVDEQGNIIAQQRMNMTLSCDHRVVDGLVGAKFLETLVSYLEEPLLIFS